MYIVESLCSGSSYSIVEDNESITAITDPVHELTHRFVNNRTDLCALSYLFDSTRDDQKVLCPLYFGLPGNENLLLLFNIISLQGNALSPSLFQLSLTFKIAGLFLNCQVLVYRFMTPSLLS